MCLWCVPPVCPGRCALFVLVCCLFAWSVGGCALVLRVLSCLLLSCCPVVRLSLVGSCGAEVGCCGLLGLFGRVGLQCCLFPGCAGAGGAVLSVWLRLVVLLLVGRQVGWWRLQLEGPPTMRPAPTHGRTVSPRVYIPSMAMTHYPVSWAACPTVAGHLPNQRCMRRPTAGASVRHYVEVCRSGQALSRQACMCNNPTNLARREPLAGRTLTLKQAVNLKRHAEPSGVCCQWFCSIMGDAQSYTWLKVTCERPSLYQHHHRHDHNQNPASQPANQTSSARSLPASPPLPNPQFPVVSPALELSVPKRAAVGKLENLHASR